METKKIQLNAAQQLMQEMLMVCAEYERNMLSSRIRRGIARKKLLTRKLTIKK